MGLAALLALLACDSKDTPPRTDAGPPPGFDDHTVPRLDSESDYEALASEGPAFAALKFLTLGHAGGAEQTLYLESDFYTLHDEWYWFRLLNNEAVPTVDVAPVNLGRSFASVEEIYSWARGQELLPLDLRFVNDGRLYSPQFYVLSLGEPRVIGLGNLIHVPARSTPQARPEIWAFELEYSDEATHEELVTFFEHLEATLPDSIKSDLHWLVRSPAQEDLALLMEAQLLRYHDRILRYRDITVPGEVEVYNAGLTAGRVHVIRAAEESLETTSSTDLLILDVAPDWLPPASGLITAIPQTPLAHVNVLAKNRGIPNAYLGQATDDASIDQLGRVRAPAILRTVLPDQLDLVPITEEQFATWRSLGTKPPVAVPQIDLSNAPYTVDLSAESLDEVDTLRPLIGGKAAGFLALLAAGVDIPETPLAISIRPFVEHMASFAPNLERMVATPEFRAQSRLRFLVLEGVARFDLRYSSAEDQRLKDAFLSGHPVGDAIGDWARAGGLARAIRDKPLAASFKTALESTLAAHFSSFGVTQGLRFRSSSTVEDIEGFNGAGLYDSNTGFLNPAAQSDPQEQTRSVEWALKKTWASYWRFEAFEERRLEAVDHLSGAMGVVVHARFDDPKELGNGVITLTIYPPEHALEASMELNVQQGAISVTNPDPALMALPEVDRVSLAKGGSPSIVRARPSSLVDPNEQLLSDAQLLSLFDATRSVNVLWLAQENADRDPAQASRTLILDFEFKDMAAGWPAYADGHVRPRGLVLKQARSLEPGLRNASLSVKSAPIPRDVLGRALTVESQGCGAGPATLSRLEVYTDPLAEPDLGYSEIPFLARLTLKADSDLPELSMSAGDMLQVDHTGFEVQQGGGTTTLTLSTPQFGATQIVIEASGVTVRGPQVAWTSPLSACETQLLHSTPAAYLQSLLDGGVSR